MSRILRAAIAMALTIAFAAVPLVVDWCAASCEASRATAATVAPPACHHASSSTARIGHHPAPCGQGHRPIVVDASGTTASASRTAAAIPTLTVAAAGVADAAIAIGVRDGPTVSPSPAPLALALASSLRI